MENWKKIKKIDSHIHILPKEAREGYKKYYGENHPWANASVENILFKMDQNNVEKAIILPINDSRVFYDMRKTNEFIASIVDKNPDRFAGFADLIIKDASSLYDTPSELEYAVKELGLKGLKIHPSNLNIPADDLRYIPVLRKAAELKVPVVYHSNPWGPGFYDVSSPERINKMIKVFPDINFICAHLGGVQCIDAIKAVSYVDISFAIFDIFQIYGKEITNNILRKFGTSRLIFGTDFPDYSYEKYFEILNKMDFTEDEIKDIGYNNAEKIILR